jgi:hypothetical protein
MSDESKVADLEVRILDRRDQGYPVEITLEKAREFRRGYISLQAVEDWRPGPSREESGRELFELLLADPKVRSAWAEARGRYPRRRLRLRIDAEAPELHALPWELLREEREGGMSINLAAAEATPFSRYMASEHGYAAPIRVRPVRILVAIANPSNLDRWRLQPIEVDREMAMLREVLHSLSVELIEVPQPCTLEALEEGLRKGPHILHLIAHGTYRQADREAVIFMANRYNQVRPMYADRHLNIFARQLTDANWGEDDKLRLVFLASCETATRDRTDAFRGFAPKLVDAGVPAVLAMQDLVPVDTAREFTRVFYRQLLQHGQVDLAANQARATLLSGEFTGVHIPVLFMRLEDGQLLAEENGQLLAEENGQLLAQDPVYAVLETMRSHEDYAFYSPERGKYLSLPIEVVHITGGQDYRDLSEGQTEATAAIGVLEAMRDIWAAPRRVSEEGGRAIARFIVLMGEIGYNKSTQLKRLVWEATEDWFLSRGKDLVLPVYVDLERYSTIQRTPQSPIEELILQSLKPHWDSLTASGLDGLLGGETTLRLLFDNVEYLTELQREAVCKEIRAFIRAHPQHQYVFSTDDESFDRELFKDLDLHILVIQPLERRGIRHFLLALPEGDLGGKPLLDRLDRFGLYDLAAVPWFMVSLVLNARTGDYPKSRTQVVRDMIGDAVTTIPSRQGMQANALPVLYALAWRMQSELTTTLPLSEAFDIMGRIRGKREYSLEEFYEALMDSKLLAWVGTDCLRFAYSRFQAYCCAGAIVRRPDRARLLDDIVASLGRLTRFRWREETLVFASGLLAEEKEGLESFLNLLVYGANLLEGERTFLAARFLMESKYHLQAEGPLDEPGGVPMGDLEAQVAAALIWRLSNLNESRPSQRGRAALLLGQLVDAAAIEHLARIAFEKARVDRRGKSDFEYSNVRMAAIMGLLRLNELTQKEILDRIDPVLVDLLDSWQNRRVDRLLHRFRSPENLSAQAIAALALSDLYRQLILDRDRQQEAQKILAELAGAFFSVETWGATLWAVTYALACLDLPTVKGAVLLPFFERENELFLDEETRDRHFKCTGYLIGLLRWQQEQARDFLVRRCMRETRVASLASVAISALGRLADPQDKSMLEAIALGRFGDYLPHLVSAPPNDVAYLQRRAIGALASVGDLGTVAMLRADRRPAEVAFSHWDLATEQVLQRSSEEIFWRLSWDR